MKNSIHHLKIGHFHVKYDQKFKKLENNNTAIRNLFCYFKALINDIHEKVLSININKV